MVEECDFDRQFLFDERILFGQTATKILIGCFNHFFELFYASATTNLKWSFQTICFYSVYNLGIKNSYMKLSSCFLFPRNLSSSSWSFLSSALSFFIAWYTERKYRQIRRILNSALLDKNVWIFRHYKIFFRIQPRYKDFSPIYTTLDFWYRTTFLVLGLPK
jgi:hypothetical protein